MEEYIPSEIARLVLGYLKESNCEEAWQSFLVGSPDLQEYYRFFQKGKVYSTNIEGKSLKEILQEYRQLKYDAQNNAKNPNTFCQGNSSATNTENFKTPRKNTENAFVKYQANQKSQTQSTVTALRYGQSREKSPRHEGNTASASKKVPIPGLSKRLKEVHVTTLNFDKETNSCVRESGGFEISHRLSTGTISTPRRNSSASKAHTPSVRICNSDPAPRKSRSQHRMVQTESVARFSNLTVDTRSNQNPSSPISSRALALGGPNDHSPKVSNSEPANNHQDRANENLNSSKLSLFESCETASTDRQSSVLNKSIIFRSSEVTTGEDNITVTTMESSVTPQYVSEPPPYNRAPNTNSPRIILSFDRSEVSSFTTPMKDRKQYVEDFASPRRKGFIPRRRLISESPISKQIASNEYPLGPCPDDLDAILGDFFASQPLAQKIADNINKVICNENQTKNAEGSDSSSYPTLQEFHLSDECIKNVLARTEADPLFDQCFSSLLSRDCDELTSIQEPALCPENNSEISSPNSFLAETQDPISVTLNQLTVASNSKGDLSKDVIETNNPKSNATGELNSQNVTIHSSPLENNPETNNSHSGNSIINSNDIVANTTANSNLIQVIAEIHNPPSCQEVENISQPTSMPSENRPRDVLDSCMSLIQPDPVDMDVDNASDPSHIPDPEPLAAPGDESSVPVSQPAKEIELDDKTIKKVSIGTPFQVETRMAANQTACGVTPLLNQTTPQTVFHSQTVSAIHTPITGIQSSANGNATILPATSNIGTICSNFNPSMQTPTILQLQPVSTAIFMPTISSDTFSLQNPIQYQIIVNPNVNWRCNDVVLPVQTIATESAKSMPIVNTSPIKIPYDCSPAKSLGAESTIQTEDVGNFVTIPSEEVQPKKLEKKKRPKCPPKSSLPVVVPDIKKGKNKKPPPKKKPRSQFPSPAPKESIQSIENDIDNIPVLSIPDLSPGNSNSLSALEIFSNITGSAQSPILKALISSGKILAGKGGRLNSTHVRTLEFTPSCPEQNVEDDQENLKLPHSKICSVKERRSSPRFKQKTSCKLPCCSPVEKIEKLHKVDNKCQSKNVVTAAVVDAAIQQVSTQKSVSTPMTNAVLIAMQEAIQTKSLDNIDKNKEYHSENESDATKSAQQAAADSIPTESVISLTEKLPLKSPAPGKEKIVPKDTYFPSFLSNSDSDSEDLPLISILNKATNNHKRKTEETAACSTSKVSDSDIEILEDVVNLDSTVSDDNCDSSSKRKPNVRKAKIQARPLLPNANPSNKVSQTSKNSRRCTKPLASKSSIEINSEPSKSGSANCCEKSNADNDIGTPLNLQKKYCPDKEKMGDVKHGNNNSDYVVPDQENNIPREQAKGISKSHIITDTTPSNKVSKTTKASSRCAKSLASKSSRKINMKLTSNSGDKPSKSGSANCCEKSNADDIGTALNLQKKSCPDKEKMGDIKHGSNNSNYVVPDKENNIHQGQEESIEMQTADDVLEIPMAVDLSLSGSIDNTPVNSNLSNNCKNNSTKNVEKPISPFVHIQQSCSGISPSLSLKNSDKNSSNSNSTQCEKDKNKDSLICNEVPQDLSKLPSHIMSEKPGGSSNKQSSDKINVLIEKSITQPTVKTNSITVFTTNKTNLEKVKEFQNSKFTVSYEGTSSKHISFEKLNNSVGKVSELQSFVNIIKPPHEKKTNNTISRFSPETTVTPEDCSTSQTIFSLPRNALPPPKKRIRPVPVPFPNDASQSPFSSPAYISTVDLTSNSKEITSNSKSDAKTSSASVLNKVPDSNKAENNLNCSSGKPKAMAEYYKTALPDRSNDFPISPDTSFSLSCSIDSYPTNKQLDVSSNAVDKEKDIAFSTPVVDENSSNISPKKRLSANNLKFLFSSVNCNLISPINPPLSTSSDFTLPNQNKDAYSSNKIAIKSPTKTVTSNKPTSSKSVSPHISSRKKRVIYSSSDDEDIIFSPLKTVISDNVPIQTKSSLLSSQLNQKVCVNSSDSPVKDVIDNSHSVPTASLSSPQLNQKKDAHSSNEPSVITSPVKSSISNYNQIPTTGLASPQLNSNKGTPLSTSSRFTLLKQNKAEHSSNKVSIKSPTKTVIGNKPTSSKFVSPHLPSRRKRVIYSSSDDEDVIFSPLKTVISDNVPTQTKSSLLSSQLNEKVCVNSSNMEGLRNSPVKAVIDNSHSIPTASLTSPQLNQKNDAHSSNKPSVITSPVKSSISNYNQIPSASLVPPQLNANKDTQSSSEEEGLIISPVKAVIDNETIRAMPIVSSNKRKLSSGSSYHEIHGSCFKQRKLDSWPARFSQQSPVRSFSPQKKLKVKPKSVFRKKTEHDPNIPAGVKIPSKWNNSKISNYSTAIENYSFEQKMRKDRNSASSNRPRLSRSSSQSPHKKIGESFARNKWSERHLHSQRRDGMGVSRSSKDSDQTFASQGNRFEGYKSSYRYSPHKNSKNRVSQHKVKKGHSITDNFLYKDNEKSFSKSTSLKSYGTKASTHLGSTTNNHEDKESNEKAHISATSNDKRLNQDKNSSFELKKVNYHNSPLTSQDLHRKNKSEQQMSTNDRCSDHETEKRNESGKNDSLLAKSNCHKTEKQNSCKTLVSSTDLVEKNNLEKSSSNEQAKEMCVEISTLHSSLPPTQMALQPPQLNKDIDAPEDMDQFVETEGTSRTEIRKSHETLVPSVTDNFLYEENEKSFSKSYRTKASTHLGSKTINHKDTKCNEKTHISATSGDKTLNRVKNSSFELKKVNYHNSPLTSQDLHRKNKSEQQMSTNDKCSDHETEKRTESGKNDSLLAKSNCHKTEKQNSCKTLVSSTDLVEKNNLEKSSSNEQAKGMCVEISTLHSSLPPTQMALQPPQLNKDIDAPEDMDQFVETEGTSRTEIRKSHETLVPSVTDNFLYEENEKYFSKSYRTKASTHLGSKTINHEDKKCNEKTQVSATSEDKTLNQVKNSSFELKKVHYHNSPLTSQDLHRKNKSEQQMTTNDKCSDHETEKRTKSGKNDSLLAKSNCHKTKKQKSRKTLVSSVDLGKKNHRKKCPSNEQAKEMCVEINTLHSSLAPTEMALQSPQLGKDIDAPEDMDHSKETSRIEIRKPHKTLLPFVDLSKKNMLKKCMSNEEAKKMCIEINNLHSLVPTTVALQPPQLGTVTDAPEGMDQPAVAQETEGRTSEDQNELELAIAFLTNDDPAEPQEECGTSALPAPSKSDASRAGKELPSCSNEPSNGQVLEEGKMTTDSDEVNDSITDSDKVNASLLWSRIQKFGMEKLYRMLQEKS